MKTDRHLASFPMVLILFSLGACKGVSNVWVPLLACLRESFSSPDPSEGTVIATVEGVPVTEADCKSWLKNQPAFFRDNLSFKPGRERFVEYLIDKKVMMILGRRAGLEIDPKYRLELRLSRESLLGQAYRDHLLKDQALTDSVIQKYYSGTTEIEASHIVLPSVDQAKKALAMLKAGQPFAAVAQKMSIDTATALKGGYMGFVWMGNPDSPVQKALVVLKDGQISDIVYTARGYEIFRRDRTKKEGPPTPGTMAAIQRRIQDESLKSKIDQAKASMKIELDQDALDKIFPLRADLPPSK